LENTKWSRDVGYVPVRKHYLCVPLLGFHSWSWVPQLKSLARAILKIVCQKL